MKILSLLVMTCSLFAANPIVIDDAWVSAHGSTVHGTYVGTRSTPAITVTTHHPVAIQNATVSGPGNLIQLNRGSRVSVLNTTANGTNPNVYGEFKGAFIHASAPASLIVENCTVNSVLFGVQVYGYSGPTSSNSTTIKILKNVFNNTDGRESDGKGGYLMTGYPKPPYAHAIQLIGVYQVPSIEIAWNQLINLPFESFVNDNINIYKSSGTSSSHLKIHDNFIQGALGASPGNGEHYSGGGINLDGSTEDTYDTTTAWVDIYNNQVTMTANYGISIGCGHHNALFNNRVVSAGHLSNGTFYTMPFGSGVINLNYFKQTSAIFNNNSVHNNVSGLIRKQSGNIIRSDWYLPGQNNQVENNQHFLPYNTSSPTNQDEHNEFLAWQKKLSTNKISVGVQ